MEQNTLDTLIAKARAARDWFDPVVEGFKDAYGEGREDYGIANRSGREKGRKDPSGARISTTAGTNPFSFRIREATGLADPNQVEARREMGMDLRGGRRHKTGQFLGTIGNDLTQDHTRSFWWLINAPQATANILNEIALKRANPELFGAKLATTGRYPEGIPVMPRDPKDPEKMQMNSDELEERYETLVNSGLIDPVSGNTRKGVGVTKGKYTRRTYNPGDVAALGIAPGAAINFGMGLMTPFGGSEGYEAAVPSAEDPTKTDNVLAEIAMKYFLGRTGNLLPYEEFRKVRPDVSKGEYNAYKAFKWDKEFDMDLSDGDFTLPAGILKGTMDGIHGPEVQFLGRSLPLTTAMIPYAGAVAGTVSGIRTQTPIKSGLRRGFGGLVAGQALGHSLEALRRNRNMETSLPVTSPLDPEATSIGL